jgi:hypothetical protein
MSERRSELKAVAASDDGAGAKAADRDFMQFSAKVVDGWTQVNNQLIWLAQTSLRNNLAAAEELRQVQNPKDIVDIQMKLARQTYDDYIDEAKKLSELMVKVSSEALGVFNMPK